MPNQDWDKFGDDIRRTVQDAIDSQDFHKLNQTITNTVNEAINDVKSGLLNAGNGWGHTFYGTRPGRMPGGDRSPFDSQSGDYSYREVDKENDQTSASDTSRSNAQRQHRARSHRHAGNTVYTQPTQSDGAISPYEYPQLFSRTTGAKVGGILLCVIGGCLGIGMLFLFLIALVALFLEVGASNNIIFSLWTIGLASAFGGILSVKGSSLLGKVKRFRIYMEEAKKTGYCEIKKLASVTDKSAKYIRKDLNRMISRGWFRQAHFDEQQTCLMVNDRLYDEYQKLMQQRKEMDEVQKAENEAGAAKNRTTGDNADTKTSSSVDPQIQEILDTGNSFISEIHACNDAIPGEEISAKISRMEELVDHIFDRTRQHPSSVTSVRRLMDYYLPTTVKLLHAYEELDTQPIQGENILSSKLEIEKTLDTLNAAFEKLLDDMFEHTAWDVSSDISVLNTMLAQEGLAGDDFKKKSQ